MAGVGNLRARLAGLALVALIGVGCGGEATESVSTLPVDPAAPARLGLVSVGEGDETIVLSPVPEPGATWIGTIEMRQSILVDGVGGGAPALVMTLRNEVREVDADGFVMHSELIDVEVGDDGDLPERDVAALRSELRDIIGMETSTRLDRYGVVVDASVEFPDSYVGNPMFTPEQMEQTAQNMTTTVPRVPLRVGATWTDTTVDDALGPTATTVTTFRLVDIDGTRYTLELDIAMEMSGEIEENGATVRMEGELSGTGTTTADTTGALEVSATSEIEGVIDISAEGESFEMEMRMDMNMRPQDDS